MAVAGSDPRATLPPPADVEPSARPIVARSPAVHRAGLSIRTALAARPPLNRNDLP